MANVETERMNPLHQIAAYCRYAQTRYAFFLTQAELVALRIRRLPTKPKNHRTRRGGHSEPQLRAAAEYKSVRWDNNTELTWIHDKEKKVYTNVISGRPIPESNWKKEYDAFVKLKEEEGNSYTSDLLPDDERSSQSTSVDAAAEAM
ncbi:hypothetical protein VTH82DRAFT_1353 [Thermothelomyces myriococcoides]